MAQDQEIAWHKSRKFDTHKETFVCGLGIRLFQIKNEDVERDSTISTLKKISRRSLLDSTDKRNLMSKIYIETIASRGWGFEEVLHQRTGLKIEDLNRLLDLISTKKEMGAV